MTEERALLFGYTGGLFQRGRRPGEQREDKLAVCHTAVGAWWELVGSQGIVPYCSVQCMYSECTVQIAQ